MKVVHFSSNDNRSGATRSALRLHDGLRSLGIDSKVLVKKKSSQDPFVIQAAADYEPPLASIVEKFYIQFQRAPLTNTCFSLGYPGVSCNHEQIVQQADVLVFHWVADFLNPMEINHLLSLRKPVLWVCHDMRAFTGGCHYPAGCRQFMETCTTCPQLKADPLHVVEANFVDQLEVFQSCPITVVAPSHWMAQEAQASAIFREAKIKTIPYGIETDIFKPANKKEARLHLGLSEDAFIILLTCSDGEEKRKGLEYLEELSYALLRKISETLGADFKYKIQFLFVGKRASTLAHLAFPTKHLDVIEEDSQLQEAYAASDVLLSLSKEDNLPNTILEAMACGAPIVGFNTGGISDLVVHGENGFLVSLGNIGALTEALLKILLNPSLRDAMGQKSRSFIEKKFTLQRQAKAHKRLYEELLAEQQELKATGLAPKPQQSPQSIRMRRIMPQLFSIAQSIDQFIQIEKASCKQQLEALADQCGGKEEKKGAPILVEQRKINMLTVLISAIKRQCNAKKVFQHSDYHFAIDAPKYLAHRKNQEVRGWFLHQHGTPIEKIRFRVGNKIFNGFTGYLRPDVASQYSQNNGSYDCGVKAPVELHFGVNDIVIEAVGAEQQWEQIGTIQMVYSPLLISFLFLPKKGMDLFQCILDWNKKNVKKPIMSVIQHYLYHRKWGGIGHLWHYDPRPIKNEIFSKKSVVLKNKEKTPKISIVTPSYNQGAFLEATIQSVLNQNYSNLEYIVIDGASQDASPAIIEKYRPLLSYAVSEPDEGQSDAIQKGLARCTGGENEIMAYLNSDDLLLPGSLAFVADFFEKNPNVDLIYGHRVLINDGGKEIGRWFTPHHNNYNLSVIDYVPQETMFWRKRLYDKIGGIDPNFHFAMDWDFLLRAQEGGAVIKRLPYFLGCFRVHESQKTNAQINTIGHKEIKQLQFRSHQRIITDEEIGKVYMKNVIESKIVQLLFSIGVRI